MQQNTCSIDGVKVSETAVKSHHGNTVMTEGDTVAAEGGVSIPTGECVIIDVDADKHSGEKTVLLAQKRDGGDVRRVEASTISNYYPQH